MKTRTKKEIAVLLSNCMRKLRIITGIPIMILIGVMLSGCTKNDVATSPSEDQSFIDLKIANTNDFTVVNLVSDVEEYDPIFIDPNLVNAWGLAFSDEGEVWVSSTEKGLATIYDGNGIQLAQPVNIPFNGDPTGGEPTGAAYNETNTFFIPQANKKSEFMYVTENGTLLLAASGTAYTVADQSASGTVYKGMAIASEGGEEYIYATDFHNAKIDVYNDSYTLETDYPFIDPDMSSGYAPFNIHLINGQLYVTYAKQLGPDNEDDEAGPGNGFVDIFNTDGSFVKRFASHGNLNSPWGIEEITGSKPAILIGNFGDGKINVYDMEGNFLKHLKSGSDPIVVEGLWSIAFPRTNLPPNERRRLYFTAGPDEETHGVFGYLKPAM
ncbi:MAG: TIGR03118 family protein [Chitinophagales bacterium]